MKYFTPSSKNLKESCQWSKALNWNWLNIGRSMIRDPAVILAFFFLLKCEEKLVQRHFLECFYLFGSKYSHSNFFTYHSTASSCRLAGCSSHYSLAGSASENFPRDNMVEELGFNSKQRTFSMVRSVR